LDQLKERIAQKKRWLAACERGSGRRRLEDVIWPLRREIRELEKTIKRYTDWMKREGLKIRPKPYATPEWARSRRAA
jgi:hypothetical protein